MILANEHYKVTVTTEYKPSPDDRRVIYQPEDLDMTDFYCARFFQIQPADGAAFGFAVLDFLASDTEPYAVLEKNILTVLLFRTILQLDLDRKTVLRCADCENTGGLQEIYSADSCYIIKGECEIFRYDKALDQIWCRCGRDIFARPTEEKCFWIEENLIHCRDWEGWHYVLDMDGNKIDEFQETLSHHTGGVL